MSDPSAVEAAASVPILGAMGIRIIEASPGRAVAELPPEPNVNHFGVTYAGSLFSLAEMLGGVLSLASFELDGMVPIVKDAVIRFRRPAVGVIRAEVSLSHDEITRVQEDARTTGKGEFTLEAVLTDARGEVVATTAGTYQIRRL